MTRQADGVRAWGRPEAVDSLGRLPGQRRRAALTGLGLAAVGAGLVLAAVQVTHGALVTPWDAWPRAGSGVAPERGAAAAAPVSTCASVGVNLPVGRFPAEGIAPERVVRLLRTDGDGTARVIAAQSFVLSSAPVADGSLNLSVLLRSGPGADDRRIEEVGGANAERSLSAAVLYDVDNVAVLDECRRPQ